MKKKGLTLIELIAVIAIMGIVFTMVNFIYISSAKLMTKEEKQAYTQDLSRQVLRKFEEDIRKAEYTCTDFIVDASNKITFKNESGTDTVITVSNLIKPLLYCEDKVGAVSTKYIYILVSNSSLKELRRINVANTADNTVIDNHVSDIQVTLVPDYYPKVILVKLDMVYKGETKTYSTSVSVRNGG